MTTAVEARAFVERRIRLQHASLIARSCASAALLANAPESMTELAHTLGLHVGAAFQVGSSCIFELFFAITENSLLPASRTRFEYNPNSSHQLQLEIIAFQRLVRIARPILSCTALAMAPVSFAVAAQSDLRNILSAGTIDPHVVRFLCPVKCTCIWI